MNKRVYGYLSRGAPPGDLSKPVLYTLLALVVLVPFGLMRTAAYLVQTQISRAGTSAPLPFPPPVLNAHKQRPTRRPS